MSEPITRETCDICKQKFDLPMARGRHGGYYEGTATLSLSYELEDFEGVTIESCCEDCANLVSEAVELAIEDKRKAK